MFFKRQPFSACIHLCDEPNKDRFVHPTSSNPIQTECPGGVHSAPFGNWGVKSTYGGKEDGHQFDGWCKNHTVGSTTYCTDPWYEWNSCTHFNNGTLNTETPSLDFYNYAGGTQQSGISAENIMHDNVTRTMQATCPEDLTDDGICDIGGCDSCGATYIAGSNETWQDLFELDPLDKDDPVTRLTFEVPLRNVCNLTGAERVPTPLSTVSYRL